MEIPAILFAAVLAAYLTLKTIQQRSAKLDASLIDSLERLAESIDQGNSTETAITQLAHDPALRSAKLFQNILKRVQRGQSLPDALDATGRASHSRTFAYLCDILSIAERSKGNPAPALKEMSRKLWEIDHLHESINAKTAVPILTLQLLGIFLLPGIYYGLAGILQTDTLDTVALVQDLPVTIYLVITGLSLTFLDWFIFRDLTESAALLPVTVTYQYLFLTTIGPMILSLMGGP